MRKILSAALGAAALVGFTEASPAAASASERASPELSRAYPS